MLGLNSCEGLAVGTEALINAHLCNGYVFMGRWQPRNASLGLLYGYKARPVGYKQRRSPRHVERGISSGKMWPVEIIPPGECERKRTLNDIDDRSCGC